MAPQIQIKKIHTRKKAVPFQIDVITFVICMSSQI